MSSNFIYLAPGVGLEPTTNSLTGSCSTIELSRNTAAIILDFVGGAKRSHIPPRRVLLKFLFFIMFDTAIVWEYSPVQPERGARAVDARIQFISPITRII